MSEEKETMTLSQLLKSNKRDDPVISCQDLHVSFKTDEGLVHAVRGVSFDLYKGETLCIVGESGSGKSVTSKTIMGILPATAVIEKGKIIYEGEDLTKVDESEFHRIRGHKIGMIFQDPLSSLNPIMRVGKQITEAMLVNKNHLKKMRNDLVSKEAADYKNNKVKRNSVHVQTERLLDESNIEFDKTIYQKNHKIEEEEYQVILKKDKYNDALKLQKDYQKHLESFDNEVNKINQDRQAELNKIYESNSIIDKNNLTDSVKKLILDTNTRFDNLIEISKRSLDKGKELLLDVQSLEDDYLKAKEDYKVIKDSIKKEIKQLESDKKSSFKKIKLDRKDIDRKADQDFKEHNSELKKAYNAKKKEANKQVINFVKDEIIKYFSLKKELKEKYANLPSVEYRKRKNIEREKLLSKFRISRKEAKQKALKVMKEVGIPQPEIRFKQYPFEFSGGMRQRIVIAIALTADPEVLICDEPTTALDVTIQAQILELINSLKAERNMSIIFITHDLGVVANMADRVAVMYAGKIVEYGTSYEIFYDPKHPYTWALLSSIPDLDSKEKLEAIPGTPPYLLDPPVGDAFAARNKYAMQIDYEKEPPFFKISDTHFAATWLLDGRAPKVEKPNIVTQRIENSLNRAGIKHD